ncbi:hypothetical protein AAZX31_08G190900 [Glycine max]
MIGISSIYASVKLRWLLLRFGKYIKCNISGLSRIGSKFFLNSGRKDTNQVLSEIAYSSVMFDLQVNACSQCQMYMALNLEFDCSPPLFRPSNFMMPLHDL